MQQSQGRNLTVNNPSMILSFRPFLFYMNQLIQMISILFFMPKFKVQQYLQKNINQQNFILNEKQIVGEDFLQQLQLDNLNQQMIEHKRMSSQQQYQANNSTIENNSQQKSGLSSKKCNCKQSQCIKLYCECYAAGVYCNGCHCINCKNNDQQERWRNQAIQNTLEKNPQVFHPKIRQKAEIASKVVDPLNLGKHNKGCACKRSGCMKKYCECYQAGVPCSENCKCTDCQNTGFVSHGNLLRQFREEDSYYSQNQILHKLLLAHNEDHLNSILIDQNGNSEFGFYKKGIPIKNEFIEESCMKLLQIIHLPDEDIFKRRDQLQSEKISNGHNNIQSDFIKEEQIEGHSNGQSKSQNQSEQIKKEDKMLKTPPQKSKRPDGTTGEGDVVQQIGENYNKDTSFDIEMACQDEVNAFQQFNVSQMRLTSKSRLKYQIDSLFNLIQNMDEEDEQEEIKGDLYLRQDIKMDVDEIKYAKGDQSNKDSEITSTNRDMNESNLTESTATTQKFNNFVSSVQKPNSFVIESNKKQQDDLNSEQNKDIDNMTAEEEELIVKQEKEKKEEITIQKIKQEINEMIPEDNLHEEEKDRKQENESKSYINGKNQQNGINGNEMEIEYHSSALKKKQELYEIRRLFILDTFIELLRRVEQTI